MTPTALFEFLVAVYLLVCACDAAPSMWTVGFVVSGATRFIGSIRHDDPYTLKGLHAAMEQASNIFTPLCFTMETATLGHWAFGGTGQGRPIADLLFTFALLVWLASCFGGSGMGGMMWLCTMCVLCTLSLHATYYQSFPEAPFILAGSVAVVVSGSILKAIFPKFMITFLTHVAACAAMECFRRAATGNVSWALW